MNADGTRAAGARSMARLVLGLLPAWLAFDRTAALTGSTLGQAGLLVGAVAVGALLLAEAVLYRRPPRQALVALGFGRPAARGVGAALALSLLMVCFYPAFALATGTPLVLREGWLLLLPGLLAQGGLGEEALFRGYLFGHLRETRGFWRAALLSVPPFLLVHLLLFVYMDPRLAAAAALLSVIMSFPLARLYDLGGRTIWAPALVHAVVQGSVKLVVAPEAKQMTMGLAWMGLSLVLPWIVFVLRDDRRQTP
jgi:membrane protease YdiL (CAAX protease family)